MKLVQQALRRLALAVVVVWGVTLVTFVVARLLPGNPVYLIVGNRADEATIQEAMAKYGFDRPIVEQYFIYMGDLLRGDLGDAWTTSNAVTRDIYERFPATLELALVSFVLAMMIALPLGSVAALKARTRWDRVARIVSTGGVAVPQFWLGLMLIYVFFFRLQLFPPPMGRLPLATMPPRFTGLLAHRHFGSGRLCALLVGGPDLDPSEPHARARGPGPHFEPDPRQPERCAELSTHNRLACAGTSASRVGLSRLLAGVLASSEHGRHLLRFLARWNGARGKRFLLAGDGAVRSSGHERE